MEDQRTAESLGTQIIEGLEAQGTRTTTIIPAGTVGNERPLETVSEVWFSPALHTAVSIKRVDPRTGETVTRLTNIRLEKPDPSLFQIPPDYTVSEPAGTPWSNQLAKPGEEGPQQNLRIIIDGIEGKKEGRATLDLSFCYSHLSDWL